VALLSILAMPYSSEISIEVEDFLFYPSYKIQKEMEIARLRDQSVPSPIQIDADHHGCHLDRRCYQRINIIVNVVIGTSRTIRPNLSP
jgi:hypothetical protein